MSDLLSIGASGVRAYQAALDVTGQNIANAATPGYARRGVQLNEIGAGPGRQLLSAPTQTGSGVIVGSITRSADAYRAEAVRTSSSEAGRTDAGIAWLERIERTLSAADIGGALTRFFTTAEGIAADPTATAPRTAMIEAARGVASAMALADTGLAAAAADLADTAGAAIAELDGLAASLAGTNAGLARVRAGSAEQARLMDERDRLLDRMATLGSLHVTVDDRGTATVRINHATGPVLVAGPAAARLTGAVNASGDLGITLQGSGGPEAVQFRAGMLGGLGDAGLRIADQRGAIAAMAERLKTDVNRVQAEGLGLDGQPGAELFAISDGLLTVTAITPRQIAAARPWTVGADSGNAGTAGLTATGAGAATATRLRIAAGTITAIDPATGTTIASAPYVAGQPVTLAGLSLTLTGQPRDGDSFTVTATGPGSRDNGNLAGFAALRRTAGHERTADEMVSANAATLAARRDMAAAQRAILDGAVAARDAVSGVNLDAEAVELIRFQQAYQASSRIIQVSRDIFQSLLDAV
jgi:flagellar hook-associated protein 1 FlgK